jgi:hypothetical protein
VRKEFWMHLLAYNLIRAVRARAAQDLGCVSRPRSFAGAWQAVRAFGELLEADAARAAQLHAWRLLVVGCPQVGDRPDQVEARAGHCHEALFRGRHFPFSWVRLIR